MATPRKRWFKVADRVGSDDTPNDVIAFFVRLAAHMNTRWARDGLDAEASCRCILSPGQLAHIAGSRTRVRCESTASAFATRFSATFTKLNGSYVVEWPKFADFQGLAPGGGVIAGQLEARESPPPRPRPRHASPREEEEVDPAAVAAAPPKRRRAVAEVPDDLTAEQKVTLRDWTHAKHPTLEPRLRDLVDACLDHHRKNSNRAGITDWVAACRTWIRNEAEGRFGRQRAPNGIAQRMDERAAVLADVARQAIALGEQRAAERTGRNGPLADVRRLRADADS